MDEGPKPVGLIAAIGGMIVCCALPILIVTGALGGIGAWLTGGGVFWIGLTAALLALVIWLRRRRLGRSPSGEGEPNASGRGLSTDADQKYRR